ncbi:MAG: hypothetical protein U0325_22540 [Polyangiales bacterium]
MSDATALTPERLVELLAEAGDLDAGTEVLDALRVRYARVATDADLLPLQARLFTARDRDRAHRAEVLTVLRDGAIDELARAGLLLEAAAAWRAMARVWPDEPGWTERLARAELLIAPLDRDGDDPDRAVVDHALARGDVHAAWGALCALADAHPTRSRVAAPRRAARGALRPVEHPALPGGRRGRPRLARERVGAGLGRGAPRGPPPRTRGSSPSNELRVARTRVLRVGEK